MHELNKENLHNFVIVSNDDVFCLLSVIDELNLAHASYNRYEAWMASEFDDYYGWIVIPPEHVKHTITDALQKFTRLYVKRIEECAINIYSENSTEREKLIVSFSVISD